MWKRLTWDPEDINKLRNRINTNVNLLNAFNGKVTRDNVFKLVQHQEDQGRQTILEWITPIDYTPQQNDFFSRQQVGTGQWLIDSATFQQWLATPRTLFCPGIPGAGKTIITAIVVNYLCMKFYKDTNIGVAYIYCNFKRNHEQTLQDLLLSILKQLSRCRLSTPNPVKSLYDLHNCHRTRPPADEILRALYSVTALYSNVFIITDALDECQVNQGCRKLFISELLRIQSKCGVNIFATSRFVPDIQREFEKCLTLEIRASDQDVRRYLDAHMSMLPKCVSRNSDLQEKIISTICDAFDGM